MVRALVRSFVLAVAGALVGAGAARAVSVPNGFVVENLAPSATFDTPTAIAFLPPQTGVQRLLVTEKRGAIYLVTNGVKAATPVWEREDLVLNEHDRGLLGLAVDPNFAINRRIYFMYTVDPDSDSVDDEDEAFGRLERWDLNPALTAVVPGTRAVLFGRTWSEGPLIASPSHTIGCLRFGSDGTLLATIGDGANFDTFDPGGRDPNAFLPGRTNPAENYGSFRAQLVGSLCGKLLRIDPATGLGLPSNPYWDGNPASVRSRIWAYGLRNPFRFAVRPGTGSTNPAAGNPGQLFLGDVGWGFFEELNLAYSGGKNFGWPCFEGVTNTYSEINPSLRWACDSLGTSINPALVLTPPVMWYSHSPSWVSYPAGLLGNSSLGGAFYTGAQWPAGYRGKYFHLDFGFGFLKVVNVDSLGQFVSIVDFADGLEGPVDLASDPQTGDFVYVSIYAQQIRRIRFTGGGGGNNFPVARATVTPDAGLAPVTVQFSGAGSSDIDGDTLSYSWDFGDQSGSIEPVTSHVYTLPGNYHGALRVDDGQGGVGVDSFVVYAAVSSDFPSTGVLDDFNRPDGPLGGSWTGDASGAVVADSAMVETIASNSIVHGSGPYGPTQECHVRLLTVTANAPEHNLMLKVQGTAWNAGHIEVHYDASARAVTINTFDPGQGWVQRVGPLLVEFQPGDQFGARAYAGGLVTVYKNGIAIGGGSVNGWPHAADGGRVGLTMSGAVETRFDDFGGGTAVIASNTPPNVVILTPPENTFYAVGDTVRLTCAASDAQQGDTTLAFRWDVDLHHNTHIHPSSYVFSARTGMFVAENHDDGSGVSLLARVKATDSGNLSRMDSVMIHPEVDLAPRAPTVQPSPPNDAQPVSVRFVLRNLGRMPAPYSRWRLLIDGAIAAQRDTLVAPLDSVIIVVPVAVPLSAGTHVLRAVADTLGTVVETNEANNGAASSVNVQGVVGVGGVTPRVLQLSNAFPNPTTGEVSVTLDLPRASSVSIEVLDVQGRTVWSERSRAMAAGRWPLRWSGRLSNGGHAPAGVYLARVRVDDRTFARRFLVLR